MSADRETRVNNLAEANRIRLLRVNFRRELHGNETSQAHHMLADAITTLPDWFAGIEVRRALMFAPEIGHTAADRLAQQIEVTQHRPLRALSLRQRMMLAEMLRKDWHRGRLRAA